MKTWYFKQSLIDLINAAGTENGPQSWGSPSWLGTVKNIQITFINDIPSVQNQTLYGDNTIVELESYIEFENGTKVCFPYFTIAKNPSTPELQVYNGELAFPLSQLANRLEVTIKTGGYLDYIYFGPANQAYEFDLQIELGSIPGSGSLEVLLPRESISGVVENVLLLSPTPPAGNGGGSASDQNLTTSVSVSGGKIVGVVSVDPTTTAVTVGGQPLPEGSVVKNSSSGQKFIKVSGGATSFVAIEVMPDADWGWSSAAAEAWEILQNL